MSIAEVFQNLDVKGLEGDPTVYFIPGFVLLMLIELIVGVRSNMKLHVPKDSFASIGMGIGSLIIGIGVKTVAFGLMMYIHQFALFEIGGQWWAWLLLFFLDDFTFYWHHRLSHQIRVLWAAHINHHSSTNYNLAVALRQSWTEILYKYIWWMLLPLLGFHPIMVLTMMSFSLIYQFWVHTKTIKRMGFLELFMNTPSHHRVHHASNVRYLDRNHAGILIIWDRMFGTFQEELEDEPVVYGITSNIHTYNLFKIAFHEFANILRDLGKSTSFTNKLKYVFMPPGWSHDGSTKTSDELREELNLAKSSQ